MSRRKRLLICGCVGAFIVFLVIGYKLTHTIKLENQISSANVVSILCCDYSTHDLDCRNVEIDSSIKKLELANRLKGFKLYPSFLFNKKNHGIDLKTIRISIFNDENTTVVELYSDKTILVNWKSYRTNLIYSNVNLYSEIADYIEKIIN